MAYNEKTAERVRMALAGAPKLVEKKMFGGIAFMVNGKMCVGVDKDDLMIRCEPDMNDELLARNGVRQFDLTGKPMKGWLLVSPDATKGESFEWWIQFALQTNKKVAKSGKK